MNKMVKKGDIVVCIIGGQEFMRDCEYYVDKAYKSLGEFVVINDNGNPCRFKWSDDRFKKA